MAGPTGNGQMAVDGVVDSVTEVLQLHGTHPVRSQEAVEWAVRGLLRWPTQAFPPDPRYGWRCASTST